MPISVKHRCIFIHVPKCGGTSIEKSLGVFQKAECLFFTNPNLFDGAPMQHLTAQQVKKILNPGVWDSFYKFAVVRDPVERFFSECRYRDVADYASVLSQAILVYENMMHDRENFLAGKSQGEKNGIADFFAHIRPQHEYLYEDDRRIVDKVVNLNSLSESWKELSSNFSEKVDALTIENATKNESEKIDEKLVIKIKQFYQKDYELLGDIICM